MQILCPTSENYGLQGSYKQNYLKKIMDMPINPQKWNIFIWRRLEFKEVLKVVNIIC